MRTSVVTWICRDWKLLEQNIIDTHILYKMSNVFFQYFLTFLSFSRFGINWALVFCWFCMFFQTVWETCKVAFSSWLKVLYLQLNKLYSILNSVCHCSKASQAISVYSSCCRRQERWWIPWGEQAEGDFPDKITSYFVPLFLSLESQAINIISPGCTA